MRGILIEKIPDKPAVANIVLHFFSCSAQRWYTVQMLYQCHLEQHYRIYARSAVIGTIQIAHKLIYLVEIHRCFYLSEQMILRYHCFKTYKFKLISFTFILFKHFYHPCLLYHIRCKKASLSADFFDRLNRPCAVYCAGAAVLYAPIPPHKRHLAHRQRQVTQYPLQRQPQCDIIISVR